MKTLAISSYSWEILENNTKHYKCFMCYVNTTRFMVFYIETVSELYVTINNNLDFVCMNCAHSHSIEDILQKL